MIRALVLCACILPLGAEAAWSACPEQTGKAIFTDDFSDDSGGWDLDNHLVIASNALHITSDAKGKSDGALNSTFNATNGDYCMVAAFPATAPEKGDEDYLALIFLASDYKNRYELNVGTSGNVWINRLANNTYQYLVPLTKVASLKIEPGAENTLRVVVKDGKMTFFVNGDQVKVQRAQISDAQNRFGFYAGSVDHPPANPRISTLKSYSVTEAP